MKLSKTIAYPLASAGIVCAFWLVMAVATRSNRDKSDSPVAEQGLNSNHQQGANAGSTPRGPLQATDPPANPLATSARNPQAQDEPGGAEPAQASSATHPANSQGGGGAGWLGLALEEDESASFVYQGGHIQGLVVSDVYPDGPGEVAGIEEDDLLMAIDGRPVKTHQAAAELISSLAPGTKVLLEIFREGQPISQTLVVGVPPKGRGSGEITQANDVEAQEFSPPLAAVPTMSQGAGDVFINGRRLSPNQIREIRSIYGVDPVPGRYWYDSRSGLYGYMGREALGYIRPGHDFGPMPSNASNGNTGVFINGRQLNNLEVAYLQLIFGLVYRGRWWLDGSTGNIGLEGNPMPTANIFAAIRQRQAAGQQGGNYSWHSGITGAYGGSSGGCSYVSIPGSGTVSSGCD